MLLSMVVVPVNIPSSREPGLLFLHNFPDPVVTCLVDESSPAGGWGCLTVVLICISLIASDIERLFIICCPFVFFLGEGLFSPLPVLYLVICVVLSGGGSSLCV